MGYTGLAVTFLLVAVFVGSWSPAARRPWLAACLAIAMVTAQFTVMLSAP